MAQKATLQTRRHRAAQLLHRGLTQSEVAAVCGVSRQTVNGWSLALARDGPDALRLARPGRKPRLTADQNRQIKRLLQAGPASFGLGDGPWTVARATRLIQQRFAVRYGRTRVIAYLREAGFVPRARTWIVDDT